jgi:hypothetical protein
MAMAVVKDEKPLWRAGLALSGPVIVLGIAALIAGFVDRPLLGSPALRGFDLILIFLAILALGMLLWRVRRRSRRMRRWDVRLSIVANLALIAGLVIVLLVVRANESGQTDVGAPQSVVGDTGSDGG